MHEDDPKGADMKKTIAAVACSSLAAASADAQPLETIAPTASGVDVGLAGERPAPIARYLLARGARAAKISPDGGKIALSLDTTGAPQIWLLDAEGGAPRQITFGAGVTFFEWSPDSKGILYGADNDGDEQESYYFISADGLSERLILPAVKGGFRNFGAFSPDAARFAYASTERNGDDFDIYVADLAEGAARRVFEGTYGFSVGGWVPGSETLFVYETVGEDGDNLHLLDAATGALKTAFKPDSPSNHSSGFGGGAPVAFSPDGKTAYFSTNNGREFTALGAYDVASGVFSVIDEAPDADLEQPTLCAGRYLAYTINDQGFDRLRVRDLKRGRAVETPALPDGALAIDCAADAPRLVIKVSAFDTPGDVLLWDIGEQSARKVFASNLAGLSAADFVKPRSVRLPARDGVMLQGMLYLPKDLAPGARPPVLFDVHGGPTGQSKAEFGGVVQYHVARGVAVFEPNVRGSTGFGRTYLGLDNREKRLDSVRDLIDLLDGLGAEGLVDPSRAAVKGGSYGGYMVNAVLGAYPGAFKAGVSLFGVGDWVAALEVASPALKASDRIEYGDIADPRWRDFYKEISPVNNADKIRVPVLYSHGAMDPRIDKAETEVMVRALRRNGVEAPYILFPDEGHGWRKLANQLFYFRYEADFLAAKFFSGDQ